MTPITSNSIRPVGGSYGYPSYGYPSYGYQQPNPISQTIDQFTRSLQDSMNDTQRSFRRMQRAWNGEPEYSVGRLASWGGGAALLWSVIDSNLRSRPEGLVALAVLGVGAWAGNCAYDWFMDRYGQHFGY
ncbi:MAG: hypothetical protein VKS61_06650 [Candidatus Sericytochromatia bacterium]|nr:hypothetical protein [Candidatus Sericytochromatia bacterium]